MTPKQSEADFQRQVTELARLFGWHYLTVRKSIGRRDGAAAWQTTTNIRGWPDCLMWHETMDRIVAAELKSQIGRPTLDQLAVLDSLARVGIETFVWRPSDWDLIEETLRWTRATPSSAPNAATPSS